MDSAAARRERRRQKILAQSGHRMKKILGDHHDVALDDDTGFGSYMPENLDSDSIANPLGNTNFSPVSRTSVEEEPQITSSESARLSQPQVTKSPILPFFLLALQAAGSRLLFEENALLVFFLAYFANAFVFGLFKHGEPQGSTYLSIGLQLCGFRPESVKKLSKSWNIFTSVLESLAFFMFSFVLTHILISLFE